MADPFVSIELLGPPRGKGRPRTRVVQAKGGKAFATIFTDKKTREYENALKEAGIRAMAGRPHLDEAVSVMVLAYMPIPDSFSRKKHAAALAGDILPEGGIDMDNIFKMIDGLNYHPPQFKGDREKRPIIWRNDSQIVAMQARKMYSDRPRLEVHVWKWG
jgi:Holliday junction resolvase RusA-like endonuclease